MNIFLTNLTVKKELDIPLVGVWSRTFGEDHNLSFQKIAQDPDKHSGIIVRDTTVLLGGDDNFAHLSLENAINQQNKWFSKHSIIERVLPPEPFALIEFVSYNTNINKHDSLSKVSINKLEKYCSYREQGITQSGRKIKVIRVDGTCKHIRTNSEKEYTKGEKVTIQTSQYYVKDQLEKAIDDEYEGVWIIASQFCQRSFTVGNIYVVMLSYDGGDAGRTAQCISRLASPFKNKNAGLVISNSFNSTRDEKIDLMLLNMISSRRKKTGIGFLEAGKEVKRGFSIFALNDNGTAVQWEMDEYLYRLATQKTSHEALAIRTITNAVINSGLAEAFKNAQGSKGKTATKLDKTFVDEDSPSAGFGNKTKLPKKEENAIKNAIQNIVEKSHLICAMGSVGKGRIGIKQSVKNIIKDLDRREEFMLQFKLDPENLYSLLDTDSTVEQSLDTMIGVNVVSSIKRKNEKLNEVIWNE
jgi:hypothetical protein